jgi:hypothetical protein
MGLLDWVFRRREDDDLQEEIRAHLSMATKERVERGEDPRDARLASLREFGNVTLTREATRRAWRGAWKEGSSSLLRTFVTRFACSAAVLVIQSS